MQVTLKEQTNIPWSFSAEQTNQIKKTLNRKKQAAKYDWMRLVLKFCQLK